MSDLDFEELDRAINDLYESLEDDEVESSTQDESVHGAGHGDGAIDGANAVVGTRDVTGRSETADDKVLANEAPSETSGIANDGQSVDIGAESSKPAKVQMVADIKPAPRVKKGQGHFMDMVHPSSDAQVKHKPDFAAERQAELKARESEVVDDGSLSSETPSEPSKITIAVVEESDNSTDSSDNNVAGVGATAIVVEESDDAVSGNADDTEASKTEPSVSVAVATDGSDDSVNDDIAKDDPRVVQHHDRTTGRRSVQYGNSNQRSKRELAQPLPATGAGVAAGLDAAAKEPYETPFLPDAKVSKRPLGRSQEATSAGSRVNRSIADQNSSTGVNAAGESSPQGRTSGRSSCPGAADWRSSRHDSSAGTNELDLDGRRLKVGRIISRILLATAIVIIGALIGWAFYYYGG